MRRTEEEEEFTMATNRLKSNKLASAFRGVSRLKEKKLNDRWRYHARNHSTVIEIGNKVLEKYF
jgi:hypothetical protein